MEQLIIEEEMDEGEYDWSFEHIKSQIQIYSTQFEEGIEVFF